MKMPLLYYVLTLPGFFPMTVWLYCRFKKRATPKWYIPFAFGMIVYSCAAWIILPEIFR